MEADSTTPIAPASRPFTPAPKPGKGGKATTGAPNEATQAKAKAMAKKAKEKLDLKAAMAAKKAAKDEAAAKRKADQEKTRAERDFAKQEAKAAKQAAADAARAAKNAPVPVTLEDVGSRSIEAVHIFQTTGTPFLEAQEMVQRLAKDALVASNPTIEPDFIVAKSVSDKTGKLAYTFWVRVSYVNPLIPAWSGVKAQPKEQSEPVTE